ncbi:MAG TPA: hypothetical protein VN802_15065 [Stellaceae bacterium]|nr:hypothetical protein [Stellaceae bacterium]
MALNGGSGTAFGADPGGLSTPDALGALLGTPTQGTEAAIQTDFGATLAGGDLVEITGICVQDIYVRTFGITITGHLGNIALYQSAAAQALASGLPTDGITGEVQVVGASRVEFNDILFGTTSGTATLATSGYPDADLALLLVRENANVLLENCLIQNSPVRGIDVYDTSSIYLFSTTVTNNGTGDGNERTNSGVAATDTASLILGSSAAPGSSANTYAPLISNNAGDGVYLNSGSSMKMWAGTITGNLQKQVRIVGSAASITGNNAGVATITAPGGSTEDAIGVIAGGLLVEAGASVQAGSGGSAISLEAGSGALLQGSNFSGGTITIEATGTSTIALAGGNIICNGSLSGSTCSTPFATAAISIDHVSAFVEAIGITGYNFAALGDTIYGNGTIQLQSSMDLGAGTPGGQQSITWTTKAGGSITASQNSSLRLNGGVQLYGAIKLTQGSNGFFNLSTGSNNVTGGVSCPWTQIPSAHVAGPTFVSPTLVLSSSPLAQSTTASQCLGF